MSTQATTTFDLATFIRAIEERDASTLLSMYSDDAEVTLTDRVNQPHAPRVLQGKDAIRELLEDICARDMSHRVVNRVQDAGGAAYIEACRYPDGTNVTCAAVLELRDGLIVRQVGVQAWDE